MTLVLFWLNAAAAALNLGLFADDPFNLVVGIGNIFGALFCLMCVAVAD